MRSHHGDVTKEYLAARAGRGLLTGASAVVWAVGSDAVSFLDGQLTQDVAGMGPGEVARSLLLAPRGKLTAVLWVLRDSERVGLVVDAAAVDATRARLADFMFRVDVELTDDPRPVHEVWGSGSPDLVRAAGIALADGWVEQAGVLGAVLSGRALRRVLVLGDADPLLDAGAIPIGSTAATAVRIEAGEPAMGFDIDESTIPQESGLVPETVSFTKGCYVGQELVSRIDSRGHVNRRLVGLVSRTNLIPPPGAEVVSDGSAVGQVTSVGESLTLRAPVALAMIRREIGDDSAVELRWEGGSAPAVVRELPLDDFSDVAHTPLTRPSDAEGDRTGDAAT